MKRRIFALLLAMAMVLSLGMAAIPDGTAPEAGTQQSAQETGEGQKAPAGDATMPGDATAPDDAAAPGDATAPDDTTAPGDATLPDDAPAPDDTRDSGADKAPADDETPPPPDGTEEDGEDGAAVISAQEETAPAAASEPPALASTSALLKIQSDPNAELTITDDDSELQDGDWVSGEPGQRVVNRKLPATLTEGYNVFVNGMYDYGKPVFERSSGTNGEIALNDYGTRTIDLTVAPEKRIRVNVAYGPDLDATITGFTLKDQFDKDVKNGDRPVCRKNGQLWLSMTLKAGYVLRAGNDDVYLSDGIARIVDTNNDNKVDLVVSEIPTVHIQVIDTENKLTALTYGGQDLVKGGDIKIEGYEAVLNAELAEGYGVKTADMDSMNEAELFFGGDGADSGPKIRVRDKNGDNKITIEIVRRPAVKIQLSRTDGVTVQAGDGEWADYAKFKTVTSGGTVYMDQKIVVTVPEAYGVADTEQYSAFLMGGEAPAGKRVYCVEMQRYDIVAGETVTIQVTKAVNVRLVNNFPDEDMFPGPPPTGPVPVGQIYNITLKGGFKLQVDGGEVLYEHYECVERTEGTVYYFMNLRVDGSKDTMTLTVVKDEDVPQRIPVKLVDQYQALTEETGDIRYTIPGMEGAFVVFVKEGFQVEVTAGGQTEYRIDAGGYVVYVDDDATKVDVRTAPLKSGAKLQIDPASGAAGDDGFLTNGRTLNNGQGRIKVKNGYMPAIDEENGGYLVEGGTCAFVNYSFPGKNCDPEQIYTIYDIRATADPVKVKLVEVRKDVWVRVTLKGQTDALDFMMSPPMVVSEGSDVYSVLAQQGCVEVFVEPGYKLTASAGTLETDDEYNALYLDKDQTEITFTVSRDTSACQHKWDSGVVTKQPTYLEKGVKTFTCTVCGETKTEDIPVLEPTVTATTDVVVRDAEAAKKQLNDTVNAAVDALVAGKTPAGLSDGAVEAIEAALKAGGSDPNRVEISTKLTMKYVTAAEKAVKGADATYDIDITVFVNGTEAGKLTETGSPISLYLPLPQASEGPIIYVVRVHDGKTEALTTTVKDETVYFSSDKFSAFAIMSDSDIAHAAVGSIPDQTYTGKAITPAVTVTVQGPKGTVTLKAGTDYTVTYKNNVNAGTATAVITGKGSFTGTKEITFKIVKPAAGGGSGSGTGAKTSPQTGDETPVALYAGLLALSAGALALTVTRRKKTSR